jgi:GGDEF-like domain/PucR C-terminal helix-turn-helix domain
MSDTLDLGSSGGAERAALVASLRRRSSEIGQAIYGRIERDMPDLTIGRNETYRSAVRETIAAVVDYGLQNIDRQHGELGPIPAAVAAQARRAARNGVSFGTVLGRYVAGHRELGEFVIREAQQCGLSEQGPALHDIRRIQEVMLEHLTSALGHEYDRERERVGVSSEEDRNERIVVGLLDGGPEDPAELTELEYELHASWHLGMVATGPGAFELIRNLKVRHGDRLLAITREGSVWAWLGSATQPKDAELERMARSADIALTLAVGEPGKGVEGWRLSHRQAEDALRIALRRSDRFARYADGRLLAATLPNDTLMKSLRQRYLIPLASQKDGGATLRRTLRSYIDVECNASSAAQALKVGRRSVKSRVLTAEGLIGCRLSECLAELDVALRLEELERGSVAEASQEVER